MAKNITLALDEDQLGRLRIYAAQHRTTVNALFRKHADELLDGDDRKAEARARLSEMMKANLARDGERRAAREQGQDVEEETWRWSREETYSGPRFDRMRSE